MSCPVAGECVRFAGWRACTRSFLSRAAVVAAILNGVGRRPDQGILWPF